MSLPVTVVALDLGEIFLLFLDSSGIDTYCRRVMATTLSLLALSALWTSLLVVLVLLRVGGESQLSGKELFSTRRVSRGGVSGLILSTDVLFFLSCGPISSEILWVHVTDIGGGLQQLFCLCIDGFLNSLFPGVLISTSVVQLGPNGRPQDFPGVSDYDLLVWSGSGIKLLKACL